jgi:hypothetical protein
LRFDSVYVIRPAHNPLGPFDCAGVYDRASDRRVDVSELLHMGHDDASCQFIEPVVGASGERLARPSDEPLFALRATDNAADGATDPATRCRARVQRVFGDSG